MYRLGSKQARMSRTVCCSLRDEPNNGHFEQNTTLTVGKKEIRKQKKTETVLLAWNALFAESTTVETSFKKISK